MGSPDLAGGQLRDDALATSSNDPSSFRAVAIVLAHVHFLAVLESEDPKTHLFAVQRVRLAT